MYLYLHSEVGFPSAAARQYSSTRIMMSSCRIFPLKPFGLADEFVPDPDDVFIGHKEAEFYHNGKNLGNRRVWSGRFVPG